MVTEVESYLEILTLLKSQGLGLDGMRRIINSTPKVLFEAAKNEVKKSKKISMKRTFEDNEDEKKQLSPNVKKIKLSVEANESIIRGAELLPPDLIYVFVEISNYDDQMKLFKAFARKKSLYRHFTLKAISAMSEVEGIIKEKNYSKLYTLSRKLEFRINTFIKCSKVKGLNGVSDVAIGIIPLVSLFIGKLNKNKWILGLFMILPNENALEYIMKEKVEILIEYKLYGYSSDYIDTLMSEVNETLLKQIAILPTKFLLKGKGSVFLDNDAMNNDVELNFDDALYLIFSMLFTDIITFNKIPKFPRGLYNNRIELDVKGGSTSLKNIKVKVSGMEYRILLKSKKDVENGINIIGGLKLTDYKKALSIITDISVSSQVFEIQSESNLEINIIKLYKGVKFQLILKKCEKINLQFDSALVKIDECNDCKLNCLNVSKLMEIEGSNRIKILLPFFSYNFNKRTRKNRILKISKSADIDVENSFHEVYISESKDIIYSSVFTIPTFKTKNSSNILVNLDMYDKKNDDIKKLKKVVLNENIKLSIDRSFMEDMKNSLSLILERSSNYEKLPIEK